MGKRIKSFGLFSLFLFSTEVFALTPAPVPNPVMDLSTGLAKQINVTVTSSTSVPSAFLPCGRVFIHSISCRGSANVFYPYNSQSNPELQARTSDDYLAVRVSAATMEIASLPLVKTGIVDRSDNGHFWFIGFRDFTVPRFVNGTGKECVSGRSVGLKVSSLSTMSDQGIACDVSALVYP
jgi:hypothetical protein